MVGSVVAIILVAIFACFYVRKSHQASSPKLVHAKEIPEHQIVSDVPGVVLVPSEKSINPSLPGPGSQMISSPSHIR